MGATKRSAVALHRATDGPRGMRTGAPTATPDGHPVPVSPRWMPAPSRPKGTKEMEVLERWGMLDWGTGRAGRIEEV